MEISGHLYNPSVLPPVATEQVAVCPSDIMWTFQKKEFLVFAMNRETISPSSSPEPNKCTCHPVWRVNRDNTVGMATRYSSNGPAIESR